MSKGWNTSKKGWEPLVYPICVTQGWPNFLTRGPNSRLPGHWRARCCAIYVQFCQLFLQRICQI